MKTPMFRSTMRPGHSDVYFCEPSFEPAVVHELHYRSKAAQLEGAERLKRRAAIGLAAVLVFVAGIAVGALLFSKLL